MKKCIYLFAFVLLACQGFSHDQGTIKGQVIDSETGDPVIGANIIMVSSMLGTCSDINGQFEFRNIHSGEYELLASCMGYQSMKTLVFVEKDKVTNQKITLNTTSIEIEGYSVIAECPYSAASLKYIRNLDLEIRPNKSSQDLLKLVPGLITAQHAGGGKAEQIFLRGFDADHGTDVNISVDGLPVNMVSHGHGQGYADLHFLIPELVEELNVYKGPYFAQFGNLATAGAIQFKTRDVLDHNLIKIEGGQFNTLRGTLLYQLGSGCDEQNGYVAAQYYNTDGPFESPLGLKRMNVFGKYFTHLSHNSKITVSMSTFSSAWDASGQIPQRAVDHNIISRFGALDDLEGGNTSRTNFNLKYDLRDDNNNSLSIQTYASDYDFKLFSNFTYFLEDDDFGDMIEQLDNRLLYGMNAQYQHIKKLDDKILKSAFGGGFRADNTAVALWHSPDRVRQELFTQASINERNFFSWIQNEIVFSAEFRAQAALRFDYFTFNVDDNTNNSLGSVSPELPHASGYDQQTIVSPKLNLVYSPVETIDLFVNAGTGFHSNDARNVVISKKINELERTWRRQGFTDLQIDNKLAEQNFDPAQKDAITLPRATGGELGFRTGKINRLNIGMAAWFLYLEREYVYVGDGGFTELSDPTQRIGLDVEARLKLVSWLWADIDFCLSEGKMMGIHETGNEIPLAPKITSTGGLTVKDLNNFNATIRYTYIGDRPANESNTVIAEGYFILNMGLSWEWKTFTFSVTGENLLDIDWNEAQFDTESQLPWENEPVSEIHFTPGNPRNFQFGISHRF